MDPVYIPPDRNTLSLLNRELKRMHALMALTTEGTHDRVWVMERISFLQNCIVDGRLVFPLPDSHHIR